MYIYIYIYIHIYAVYGLWFSVETHIVKPEVPRPTPGIPNYSSCFYLMFIKYLINDESRRKQFV